MRCCTVCPTVCAPGAGGLARPPRRTAGLDGRVLDALAAEPEGVIGFQGLRRRLGAHPESLSRALDRLEADGLLEKRDGGYHVTDDGMCSAEPAPARATTEVLRAPLPPDLDAEAVAALLEGRWAGPLRFYGRADAPGEVQLLFVREPGGELVRVRIVGGTLVVETEGTPDATLLGHLFALLSGVTGSGPTPSSSAKRAHASPAATAARPEPAG